MGYNIHTKSYLPGKSRGPNSTNPGFLAVAAEKRNHPPKHDGLFILLIKGESTGTFIVQPKELTRRDESLLLCAFSPPCPMLLAYTIT